MKSKQEEKEIQCLKLTLRGAVQGVGFRPFVYQLACELGLSGIIQNSSYGVLIEAEGPGNQLSDFLLRIQQEKPPLASIQILEPFFSDAKGYTRFEILESLEQEPGAAWMLPDIALCAACRSDVWNPRSRRYRYPFTNCSHCGPRYSILESIPYDRKNTSMKKFEMCEECRWEYDDPADRRFHAQPNACPRCGPQTALWNPEGEVLAEKEKVLEETVGFLKAGKIVAVKGLGGFHLMADAKNEEAVRRLRERKRRERKPLAVMMSDLKTARQYCEISLLEARLLESPEAPIVLLLRKENHSHDLAPSAAPGNPYLGVMLAYTPLHELLLQDMGGPLIATSGNLSEEPIAIDNQEACSRLRGIADYFLVHDRPITRPVDDSVIRMILGREMILRRARGFAPLPAAKVQSEFSVLALGGHLKNTIAQNVGGEVFLSQHIGDLENAQSLQLFHQTLQTFKKIYRQKPEIAACDFHPQYASTGYAEHSHLPVIRVQHHYAHALACMADNEIQAPALAVVWDGAGLGTDGTVWGGEFLWIGEDDFIRTAHIKRFRLPGQDQASLEPRRSALAVLCQIYGEAVFKNQTFLRGQSFSKEELQVLETMLLRGFQAPWTTSMGRLFDAVSAILGLSPKRQFEGEAAMALEFAIANCKTDEVYPFWISQYQAPESGSGEKKRVSCYQSVQVFDWEPMIRRILTDHDDGIPVEKISAKFHNTLAEGIVKMAISTGETKVVLSGGCFQNKYLLERAILRLQDQGFSPYWHQRIPPNDGGIAVGQMMGALRQLARQSSQEKRSHPCV